MSDTTPLASTLCLPDVTACGQVSQASPFHICILQAIKYCGCEWPGNEASCSRLHQIRLLLPELYPLQLLLPNCEPETYPFNGFSLRSIHCSLCVAQCTCIDCMCLSQAHPTLPCVPLVLHSFKLLASHTFLDDLKFNVSTR